MVGLGLSDHKRKAFGFSRFGDVREEVFMIRAAVKDDLEAVYGLMLQLSWHDFTKEQFESCYFYNLENNHIIVHEQDKHVCGCGVLSVSYHLHFSRKTAEIVNLVVDVNARGCGIGKELLAALEQIAADNDCACIKLDSAKHRSDAHRFYAREGFACNHYKFTKELNNAANFL